MINYRDVNKYCKDDISLIENYEQAVNDKEIWDCHHRKETDLGLSRHELMDRNLYYNRPASELIFLTPSEHHKLHSQGENHPLYDKPRSEVTKQKISNNMKGEKHPLFGTHPTWMNNGIVRVFPRTQEEIEHYRSLGYDFGFKLKT